MRAFRMRRIALWRDHGEVTRALLAVGVVLLAGFGSAFLIHAPEPPLIGMNGTGWIPTTVIAVVLEIAAIAAGILWFGALAFVVGGLVAGAWALLVIDHPWLYEPAHIRLAMLGLIAVLIVALIVVAREFSVFSLRLAAVAAVAVVAMMAVRLGRLEAREDLAVAARAAATELDVQLADLVREGSGATVRSELSDDPTPGELEMARALSSPALLRRVGNATSAIASQVQESALADAAQSRIQHFCVLADGHAFAVVEPGAAATVASDQGRFVSSSLERCLAGAGADDEDDRRIGRPSKYAEARTAATWAVMYLRAEVEHVDPASLASATSAAVAAAGGPERDGAPVDLLTSGGKVLVGGLPGIGDPDVPAALTLLGWVVLVGAMVLGYRWLEILNGQTMVGPVAPPTTASPTTASPPPDEDTRRLAELRRHIVRNIPEPGAVPGAETLQPVTDLVEATGDPSSAVIRALLKLVGVLFPKTGYTIEATFSPPPVAIAGSAKATDGVTGGDGAAATVGGPQSARDVTVTVLLKDARTGAIRATIVETSPSEQVALKAAGYRVAAYVLSQSSRVPRWARWDESNAKALCKFTEAYDGGSATVDELEVAVRTAPSSGVLLALLGHRHDLEQRPARALSAYLRAAALYPRYPVARYRTAISFSLLAAKDADRWAPSPTLEAELDEAFKAFSATLGISWDCNGRVCGGDLTAIGRGREAVIPLACIGDALLETNSEALGKLSIAHHAFRRSERSYWLTLLFKLRSSAESSGFSRRVLAAVNESARVALHRRACVAATRLERADSAGEHEREASRIAEEASRQGGLTWQVDYNLACAASIQGELDRAMDLLRGLVRRPHVEQLTRAWAESDPDLAHLRGDHHLVYFERFLSHLRSDPNAAWGALVDRYARAVRARYGEIATIDPGQEGLEALYTGAPPRYVPVNDLRVAGEMPTSSWLSHVPRPSQRRPPKPLRVTIDRLLARERAAAIEALGTVPRRAVLEVDLAAALDAGRRELGEPDDYVVIATPATFDAIKDATTSTKALVVRGSTRIEHPLLYDPRRRPLIQFVAQDIRLEHTVGEDIVRFVVHERVGFMPNQGSPLIALVDH
jgi:hypothetical protein